MIPARSMPSWSFTSPLNSLNPTSDVIASITIVKDFILRGWLVSASMIHFINNSLYVLYLRKHNSAYQPGIEGDSMIRDVLTYW